LAGAESRSYENRIPHGTRNISHSGINRIAREKERLVLERFHDVLSKIRPEVVRNLSRLDRSILQRFRIRCGFFDAAARCARIRDINARLSLSLLLAAKTPLRTVNLTSSRFTTRFCAFSLTARERKKRVSRKRCANLAQLRRDFHAMRANERPISGRSIDPIVRLPDNNGLAKG